MRKLNKVVRTPNKNTLMATVSCQKSPKEVDDVASCILSISLHAWYYIVQKFENPAALGTLSLPFLPLDGGIFNPKA